MEKLLENKVRLIVREILSEIFSEAEETTHYLDRVKGRLQSYYTYPKFPFAKISPVIDVLEKTNFPRNLSYGIKLISFHPEESFEFQDPRTDKTSQGNEVWAVIRNNRLVSIMFRFSGQGKFVTSPVDVYLNASDLIKNYEVQAEKGKIGEDGMVFYYADDLKVKEPNKYQLDLPTVELRGKTWYLDGENGELINIKNIKSKLNIYGDLKPEEQDLVLKAV